MGHLDTILSEGTVEVLEQELVQDGTGLNYRPLLKQHTHALGVVKEYITYMFEADSPAWAQVKEVDYEYVG